MSSSGLDRVKAALQHVQTDRPPKGELWLGADILHRACLEDTLDGRIRLVRRLKQDIICISVAHEPFVNKTLGYRYFPVSAIQEVMEEATDLFVMIMIDGPFQRLTEKMGLMKVFSGWMGERENVLRAYENERARVESLLGRCLEYPVHGIVIADDLAGDRSPFLDPRDIQRFFSPFYAQAVSRIHEAHAVALFHSCGNISSIVLQLVSNGFDGLAAIQGRTNDLMALKGRYGSHLVLMAGIEGDILEQERLSPSDFEKLEGMLTLLAQDGGLILSSSCGLYSGRFLDRIEAIYSLV